MSRAMKFHHRERLMRKRKHYHNYSYIAGLNRSKLNDPEIVARYVNTPCPCSCWMCCNPRHSWVDKKHTIQERRFFCGEFEDEC